jgi:uncharacterized membrane protein
VEFDAPHRLWFAVPILIALFISYRRGGVVGIRGSIVVALRGFAIVFLVLALAMPFDMISAPTKRLRAVLDISQSVAIQQGDKLLSRARGLAQELNLPLDIVPFAGSVSGENIASVRVRSYEEVRRKYQNLDTGYSNIYGALSGDSSDSLSLLLSDGYENVKRAEFKSAASLMGPIFPLVAEGSDPQERLRISQLRVPKVVAVKKQAQIQATITNYSEQSQDASVIITHGEHTLSKQAVTLAPKHDLVVTALSDSNAEGLLPVTVALSWRDGKGEHTRQKSAWLGSEKRDSVLLLSGDKTRSELLRKLLTDEAYQLTNMSARKAFESGAALDDYKVVILNNVHSSEVGERALSGLRSFVENGGSLLVIGGDSSFGLGNYIGTTLEDILPVRLIPPHKELKRLGVAVQLVVDKSRSMVTDNRLEYAKRAASAVVETLKDDDFIGVIGFDDVPFVAIPIAPVARVRSIALSRISRLFPTSRTNLYPALEEARRGLASVRAGRKHIVVLTDGKIPDPGRYYFELIKQARFLGMTLSTILVGGEADDGFLEELARRGGGAFYQTTDPRKLPKIFLSDVKVSTGEQTLEEEDSVPVITRPNHLTSTTITSYPDLKGFVQTELRPDAKTELVVRSKKGIFPLLASKSLKRGMVIAFTSDATGQWSSRWFRWSKIHEFWSDVLTAARRETSNSKGRLLEFEARTWMEGQDSVIDVALFDAFADKGLVGRIETPSGETILLAFNKINRGHYQARIEGVTAGTYKANLKAGDFTLPAFAWDVAGDLFGERAHHQPNMSVLQNIAFESGGIVNPTADSLRRIIEMKEQKNSYMWECVLLAACVYVLELIVRLGIRFAGFRRT